MKRYFFLKCLILTVSLVLLASCATAPIQLGNIWVDPTYDSDGFDDFLVIGISQNPSTEQMFESELTARLLDQGVQAFPYHKIMASGEIVDKESILAAIEGSNIDAVLITRLLSLEKETEFVPGTTYAAPQAYYRDYWGYYRTAYTVVHEPGYMVETHIATLESNLYSVANEQLVWSALSRTFKPEAVVANIQSLSLQVTQDLDMRGFLKKK